MRKLLPKKDQKWGIKPKDSTDLVNPDYQRKRLFKKGILLMADEKLEEAASTFEQALRMDPNSVETLLKLGYSRFHLGDHAEALRVYDKVLDIDVANAEAWNLKGLVHYEQKHYSKALDAAQKSVESDPNYGMGWYNKACFLSLLNQVPEAIESLKRSIEIDVKNARKAVKDRDFINVRLEKGFRRIIEVVVLESIRQGYHTIGAIVWTTFLSKADTEEALHKLMASGLVVRHEKRETFSKIPIYNLAPSIADKVVTEKKNILGITKKQLPGSLMKLKDLSRSIQTVRTAIENEDVKKVLETFEVFIDTKKCGAYMIELYFEEHREIRLWKIRLEDHGVEYLKDHKGDMLTLFDNIEVGITKQLRGHVK